MSTPSDPAARPDDARAAALRPPAPGIGDESAAAGVPLAAQVPGDATPAGGPAPAREAADGDRAPAREEVAERDEVTVRRAPKVPVFLAMGAVAGLVVAFVVTIAFPFQVGEGASSTLGYMALWGVVVGMLVGGVVAIVLDRRASARARRFSAERRRAEAEPPVVEGDLEA